MNFKQLLVIRILLTVVKFVAPTEWLRDIDTLSSHILVNGPKEGPDKDQLILELKTQLEVRTSERNNLQNAIDRTNLTKKV